MASNLDRLLDQINPSCTINVVEQHINQALAGYYRQKNTITTWDNYRETLAEFMRQARNVALQMPPSSGQDIDMNFHEAISLLRQEYPGNTVQTVFDIMQTGAEGGIYAIFRTLSRLLAEQYAQNEINARVLDFWNNLSTEEKIAIPDEYITKFKDILPAEIVNGTAIRVRASFWKVLQDHPRMIKRFRDIR
ncbi:hypothetical protein JW979_09505 [bacterium]|nr:hypothetical protein [candidate division CSSED10-310 bacterium]